MGEGIENRVGGEPTKESAPKLEEMTPEQQEVHDTATKREAEEISDEVKIQESAIEFARRTLDADAAESLKKSFIERAHDEANEENFLENHTRETAQKSIEAMARARMNKKPYEMEITPAEILWPDVLKKTMQKLEVRPSGTLTYDGKDLPGNAKVFQNRLFYSPLGQLAFYERDIPSSGGKSLRLSFVRGFPPKEK